MSDKITFDRRYRMLADVIGEELNTFDDQEGEAGVCIEAIREIAEYVRSLPCTCVPGYDGEPCRRCRVLGLWHGKPMGRKPV